MAPEQVAAGVASDWQVGLVVSADAGAVWASVTPTLVSVTVPVFLATNV